jgi:hypothetical protein
MVEIQSKEAIDKISDELKVQPSMEIDKKLIPGVQPVFEVGNNQTARIARAIKTTTGAINILTTKTGKRTFLTGLFLSYMHDVAADSTEIFMTATIKETNLATNIFNVAKLTATAAHGNIHVPFNPPIEIKENTNVSMTHNFTVGAGFISGLVQYYETDPQ